MKTIYPMAGDSIYTAACQAVAVADKFQDVVMFSFNGHDLSVRPGSNPHDTCTIYSLLCEIDRYKKGYIK